MASGWTSGKSASILLSVSFISGCGNRLLFDMLYIVARRDGFQRGLSADASCFYQRRQGLNVLLPIIRCRRIPSRPFETEQGAWIEGTDLLAKEDKGVGLGGTNDKSCELQ